MTGERDLERLLRGMQPELAPGAYVFVAAPGWAVPAGLHPFATVREDEGLTLVLTREEADRAALAYHYVAARVTLRIASAAVGLTAAVSTRLARAGLSCNVIAGYHHDHLFAPYERAAEVHRLLEDLARGSEEVPPPASPPSLQTGEPGL